MKGITFHKKEQSDSSQMTLREFIPAIGIAAMAALFMLTTIGGVDNSLGDGNYGRWSTILNGKAEYLSSEVSSDGRVRHSVMGILFQQWTPAVAMMSPFMEKSLSFLSLLCAGTFFLACWFALRKLYANSNALLGMAIIVTCTSLAYYARVTGAEPLCLAGAGIIFLQTVRALKSEKLSQLDWVIVCSAAFMLAVAKSFMGLYALPGLVAVFVKSVKPSVKDVLIKTLIGMGSLAGVLWISCTHNYWMTGDPMHVPYKFGDSAYQSLNLKSPAYVYNVLFDTFHGAFTHHPFVLVGLLCMIGISIKFWFEKRWLEASVCSSALFAVAANIYIQGCWTYWWMSSLAFAARGVVLPGLIAVIGFLVVYDNCKQIKLRIAMVSVTLLCAIWSFLLSSQGPTQYLFWSDLLNAQWSEFCYILTHSWITTSIVTTTIVFAAVKLGWNKNPIEQGTIALLVGLYATLQLLSIKSNHFSTLYLIGIVVVASTIFAVAVLIQKQKFHPNHLEYGLNLIPIVLMCICLVNFARLSAIVSPNLERQEIFVKHQTADFNTMISRAHSFDRADFQDLANRAHAFRMRCDSSLNRR